MSYCVNVHHNEINCLEAGLAPREFCSGCRIVLLRDVHKEPTERKPRPRTGRISPPEQERLEVYYDD